MWYKARGPRARSALGPRAFKMQKSAVRVLSHLCHCFLATLYLSKLSLANCLALLQVPASSALYAIRSQAGL